MPIAIGVLLVGAAIVALGVLAEKAAGAVAGGASGGSSSSMGTTATGSSSSTGITATRSGAVPSGLSVPGISASDASAAINTATSKYNVPLDVFYGMFDNETSLGADVSTSSGGAVGPFQFVPSTAATYAYPLTNRPSLAQFQQQADSAAHLLSDLYNQLGHSWTNALAAYNAGPGNISAGLGYAARALAAGQQLVGG
jgi:soluble lytic murein transglycosylase-like protein